MEFWSGKPPSFDMVTRVLEALDGSGPHTKYWLWAGESIELMITQSSYIIPYFDLSRGILNIVIEEEE